MMEPLHAEEKPTEDLMEDFKDIRSEKEGPMEDCDDGEHLGYG